MYVNEMQRTINGLGHAPGGNSGVIIPYGHWQPYRPGAITRGPGFGDVPNDFEASVDLQYIPVRQGWYYGHPVDGGGYPDAGLPKQGFGDAASDAAIQQLAKTERLRTVLQVVSTLSVATMATLAIIRTVRYRRSGRYEPLLGDDE